jgi:DNA repair photolyase
MVREALVAIRDCSTLNVRILTRSPLARKDFDVFKTFGDRLLLGTSLPTLDSKISRAYEGRAPAPQQRLKLLLDAHEAGIHTYVAVAPVFPESGYQGVLDVFNAVKAANPHTIFMEPVNLRLGVAERVQAMSLKDKDGLKIDMKPFTDTTAWSAFAIQSLRDVERSAKEAGVFDRPHLWPDFEALGAQKVLARQPDPHAYLKWLQGYWSRVSEWPGK